MHLLVVEDDPDIAAQLALGMQRQGYGTQVAATGTEALSAIGQRHFDAVILDRLLPDINGIDLLGQMRDAGAATPVLMLSALGSVNDRIQGLHAGVDDYLTKPFDMGELVARIQAIVRRVPARDSEGNIAVGSLEIDAASHSATFAGAVVTLNRKQFSLLAHLMRHADRLVTRSMLLESVWGYAFEPTTNIVESNLSRLRGKLLEVGCDAIETRRGSGYILRSFACQ